MRRIKLRRHAAVLLLFCIGCNPAIKQEQLKVRQAPSQEELEKFLKKVKKEKFTDEAFGMLTLRCFPAGIPVTDVERALDAADNRREENGMTIYEFWPSTEKPQGKGATWIEVKVHGEPKRIRNVGTVEQLC